PAWDTVEQHWQNHRGQINRPGPGQDFPNFFVFAYFALARWETRPELERGHAPEQSFRSLQQTLSVYERVRTPGAHSITSTSKRDRKDYFRLIDRWLGCLIAACPAQVTRESLLDIIEPLPTVAPDGSLSWS